jgi:ribose 1,5-bisphosphokinase
VTRSSEAGAEDHDAASEAGFAAAVARGDFALHWRAHGLGYGIPATIAADLAAGRNVVVNVSRAVLDEAGTASACSIAVVTAPPEVLAERSRKRNREDVGDIAARLRGLRPMPCRTRRRRHRQWRSLDGGRARRRRHDGIR